MGQAQINVRTRACSRTSFARTKQAALTHNVRGKELNKYYYIIILYGGSPASDILHVLMGVSVAKLIIYNIVQ